MPRTSYNCDFYRAATCAANADETPFRLVLFRDIKKKEYFSHFFRYLTRLQMVPNRSVQRWIYVLFAYDVSDGETLRCKTCYNTIWMQRALIKRKKYGERSSKMTILYCYNIACSRIYVTSAILNIRIRPISLWFDINI